ncbi:MAG: imidazole glycerol phosphate synthase subunit HisH [Burkholderiales bacterium]|nr:imidazole glycerol phosphate synthase subunit HisH [Burkholderiales bacterium]
MIAIVDYGLGNVLAFSNMFKRLNIEASVARSPDELTGADRIILPGVGAFDHAMELLQASGMRESLDELVIGRKVPVLGVCVGMQILAESSDEGRLPGLGWIDGRVRAFDGVPQVEGLPLPHMGWNDVQPTRGEQLFAGMEEDARFYFLHSFFFDDARPGHSAATASYGIDFCCAVRSGNVLGVQFHPEKSHHWGSRLLQNFAELTC